MIKSTQNALVQETAIAQIDLRTQELSFYTMLLGVFGVQAALIATAFVNAIANVSSSVYENGSTQNEISLFAFWITLGLGMITSMLLLFISTLSSLWGQELALRGPIGSMIIALNGLLNQQYFILDVFSIVLVLFGLNTIAIMWVVTDNSGGMNPNLPLQTYGAVVPSIVLIFGMYCCYKHCKDLYHRFKFSEEDLSYVEAMNKSYLNPLDKNFEKYKEQSRRLELEMTIPEEEKVLSPLDRMLAMFSSSAFSRSHPYQRTMSSESFSSVVSAPGIHLKNVSKKSTVLQSQEKDQNQNLDSDPDLGLFSSAPSHLPNTSSDGLFPAFQHAGHILMKIESDRFERSSILTRKEVWEGRYLVVIKSLLYFYLDKSAFELNPNNPIRQRPTVLKDFTLSVQSQAPPLGLTLTPKDEEDGRSPIEFRFLQEAELAVWMEVLCQAMQQDSDS